MFKFVSDFFDRVVYSDDQYADGAVVTAIEYNPDKLIADYTRKFGVFGREVLYAFNDVDPLDIGVGDNNEDEYMSEAEHFFLAITTGRTLVESVSHCLEPDREYIVDFDLCVFTISSKISDALDNILSS
jgi:hypothetical protein